MRRLPWALVAAALCCGLGAVRALHLESVLGGYTACAGCYALPALAHDGWMLALLCLLLAAASSAGAHAARLALSALAALLLLAQALDVELLQLFNQRLYAADLLRFGGDPAAAWSVARAQWLSRGGSGHLIGAVLVAVVVAGLLAGARRAPLQARILLVLAVGAAAFSLLAPGDALRTVHHSFIANVIEANRPPGRLRAFSPAHAARAEKQAAALPQSCDGGGGSARNVVIVVVESLSAYQSALLGGPRDWLPRLDALARANHYFTRFYANGFTTDSGEIALVTGRAPLIPAGQEWYTIPVFGAGADTLPGVMHRAGGQAFYFTTADLSFLASGAWLRALAFDGVEGSENAFYAGKPRAQFGAAEDAALFARFDNWLDGRRDSRPFAALLLTVSTHPPFIDPRTGRIDPPGSFGYIDEQLARFHDRLQQRGFLRDGILIITGDHRSMTPLLDDEYRRFGERAYARIPLIVAGAVDLPAVVDAAFQQSDLPASLAQVVGAGYCRNAFAGDFLRSPPQPPAYIIHSRGDDRDRVEVFAGNATASYRLDGDDSRWDDPARLPDAAMVAGWIDAQRIRNAPDRAAAIR